jgi:LPXTG-motif cell wall-anchored protein
MIDARTATVAALLTQAATNAPPGTSQPKATNTQVFAQGTPDTSILAGTATPSPLPTATALPKTGFAEEAGIPGLMGVAVALLIVIVVARGLRARTS